MTLVKKSQQFEIVKNQISSMPDLSKKERAIYLSNKAFPKIKDIADMNDIVNPLHTIINSCIMDKGINMPEEEITYLKQRVVTDVLQDFSYFTLEEIRLATYYGVREELGKYYGINPTTFYKWFKDYRYEMLSKVNLKVTKLLPKPKEIKPSKSETDQDIFRTVISVYDKLKSQNEYDFYDIGNFVFNFLYKLDVIVLTVEQKNDLIKSSTEHFKCKIEEKNKTLIQKGQSIQKIDLERAFNQIEENSNPTFEHQIKIGAKRLALYNFLKDCSTNNVDLKTIISDKLNKK